MLKYSIGATDSVWAELMRQVSRLEQMDRFPFGPEAKKDLGKALAQCESLDEAREVIDEFVMDGRAGAKCPLFGDILAVIDQRRSRKVVPIRPEPVEYTPSGNYCGRCQNAGFYGGRIGGEYEGVWKWCDCQAARMLQRDKPGEVDEMNAVREKIIRRFAASKKKLGMPDPTAMKSATETIVDDYKGEF